MSGSLTDEEVITTKGRRFPKTVYMKWDALDTDSPFLSADQEAADLLEANETTYVATYELKEVRKGSLNAEFK